MESQPTPQMVIQHFSLLTGIRIRIASHGQELQAIEFAKHFSLKDLEDVIGWIQKKIASGDKRMDERSLSWRNVFGEYGSGNEFATFQDRLAMAQKTIRIRPVRNDVPVTRNVGNGSNITVFQPAADPAPCASGEMIAEQLAQFKKQLSA